MNKVSIKTEKVSKVFEIRSDYLKESGVYEKLGESGLAPKVLFNQDGEMEFARVDGRSFADVLASVRSSLECCYVYYNTFLSWYTEYRKLTNLGLGEMDLNDFILGSDNVLYGIDFEHTKPSFPEEDIARVAANICLITGEYTKYSEQTIDFLKLSIAKLGLSKTRLLACGVKAFADFEKEKGITADTAFDRFVINSATCEIIEVGRISYDEILELVNNCTSATCLILSKRCRAKANFVNYFFSSDMGFKNIIYLRKDGAPNTKILMFKKEEALCEFQKVYNDCRGDMVRALSFYSGAMGLNAEEMKGYKKGLV